MVYICSSPYQIFNAIHHMWNIEKKIQQDLIIINFFDNSENVYNSISKSGIFGKVYYVKNEKKEKNLFDNVITILRIIFPKIAAYYLFSEYEIIKPYVKVVSSTYITDTTLVMIEMNRKRKVVLEVIEDGTGPYFYGAHGYSKLHELFSRITGRGIPALPYGKGWFYEPAFIQKEFKYKIDKMPKAFFRDEQIELINKAIDIQEREIKEKYIFIFDGIFPGGPSFEKQISTLNSIAEIVGAEKVAVKFHPSYKPQGKVGFRELKQYIPWELYCMNNDMGSKVLIVANSTAGFTPKFMFNQEPMILFLNRYYSGEYKFKNSINKMQRDLRDIYIKNDLIKFIVDETELQYYLEETAGGDNE